MAGDDFSVDTDDDVTEVYNDWCPKGWREEFTPFLACRDENTATYDKSSSNKKRKSNPKGELSERRSHRARKPTAFFINKCDTKAKDTSKSNSKPDERRSTRAHKPTMKLKKGQSQSHLEFELSSDTEAEEFDAEPVLRMSSARKCQEPGCPNNGTKCYVHGKERRTCKIKSCIMFAQNKGFCLAHHSKYHGSSDDMSKGDNADVDSSGEQSTVGKNESKSMAKKKQAKKKKKLNHDIPFPPASKPPPMQGLTNQDIIMLSMRDGHVKSTMFEHFKIMETMNTGANSEVAKEILNKVKAYAEKSGRILLKKQRNGKTSTPTDVDAVKYIIEIITHRKKWAKEWSEYNAVPQKVWMEKRSSDGTDGTQSPTAQNKKETHAQDEQEGNGGEGYKLNDSNGKSTAIPPNNKPRSARDVTGVTAGTTTLMNSRKTKNKNHKPVASRVSTQPTDGVPNENTILLEPSAGDKNPIPPDGEDPTISGPPRAGDQNPNPAGDQDPVIEEPSAGGEEDPIFIKDEEDDDDEDGGVNNNRIPSPELDLGLGSDANEFMSLYQKIEKRFEAATSNNNEESLAFYGYLISYFDSRVPEHGFHLGSDKDLIIKWTTKFEDNLKVKKKHERKRKRTNYPGENNVHKYMLTLTLNECKKELPLAG